jgi:hypothetical protein
MFIETGIGSTILNYENCAVPDACGTTGPAFPVNEKKL